MASSSFASVKQLAVLALVGAVALGAGDYLKNPGTFDALLRPGGRSSHLPASEEARVGLLLRHMCCSGCLDDLREGLRGLRWIGRVSIVEDENERREPPESLTRYQNWVSLDIRDVEAIDFVELDRAIRATGLSVEKIEIQGLGHFSLDATMHHICCEMCATALDKGLDLARTMPSLGRLRWLDGAVVRKDKKMVTLFVGYNSTVDVVELFSAFHELGFAPTALRVVRGDGPEQPPR